MTTVHPNVALLSRINPADMSLSKGVFSKGVVFHYFNPRLPELQGDYVGLAEIERFFRKIGALSDGTFKVNPVSVTPIGNELVVTQTRNTMTKQGENIDIDVVVVWRVVDGRIAEVWDIPSVYVAAS